MKATSTRLVFNYWDALRGERAAPERGEIEPGALRHALLDTFILEAGPDGLRFRLAGTRVSALFGELKERSFASIWPSAPARDELTRLIGAALDESIGAVAGLRLTTARHDCDEFELLVLPLRHMGKTQARMLGALSPVTPAPWLGLVPVAEVEIRSMRMIWSRRLSDRGLQAPKYNAVERRARFTVLPGGRA